MSTIYFSAVVVDATYMKSYCSPAKIPKPTHDQSPETYVYSVTSQKVLDIHRNHSIIFLRRH